MAFDTSMGTVQVDLFDVLTPQTVANFLAYVNDNRYQNTIVHRLDNGVNHTTPFVIQGGGYLTSEFTQQPLPSQPAHIAAFASPQNEFHRSNTRGTIAMAKLPNQPDSATSEWFFNMNNNGANLDSTNGGFTVFGWVVGNGLTVLDNINALPNPAVTFGNPNATFTPPKNGADFVNVNNITVVKTHPNFQNPVIGNDVDNNGKVQALDALKIINDLIANKSHAVIGTFSGTNYLDVSGDGKVSALDALRVINALSIPPSLSFSAEPSFTSAPLTIVPEPGSLALATVALLALAGFVVRRRRCAVR